MHAVNAPVKAARLPTLFDIMIPNTTSIPPGVVSTNINCPTPRKHESNKNSIENSFQLEGRETIVGSFRLRTSILLVATPNKNDIMTTLKANVNVGKSNVLSNFEKATCTNPEKNDNINATIHFKPPLSLKKAQVAQPTRAPSYLSIFG